MIKSLPRLFVVVRAMKELLHWSQLTTLQRGFNCPFVINSMRRVCVISHPSCILTTLLHNTTTPASQQLLQQWQRCCMCVYNTSEWFEIIHVVYKPQPGFILHCVFYHLKHTQLKGTVAQTHMSEQVMKTHDLKLNEAHVNTRWKLALCI